MKTNYFELRGMVGNPPEVHFTPNGKTVATFSVYTRERWSDSGGETREKSQRHQITAWGPLASFAQQRLSKGTRVEITGRIDQQSWGEGGSCQYKTVLVASEIVLSATRCRTPHQHPKSPHSLPGSQPRSATPHRQRRMSPSAAARSGPRK